MGISRSRIQAALFGFSSYCVLYPEYNMGIILLTNELDWESQGELVIAADKIFESVLLYRSK